MSEKTATESLKKIEILIDESASKLETMYLVNIPGMRESIIEGLKTHLEECIEELDW